MGKFWLTFLFVAAPTALLAAVPDARDYEGPAWSPFLAGGLIGLLTWLTFYFSRKPVGASSSYASLAGIIGKAVAPGFTKRLEYYRRNPPKLDWEILFIAATIAGGFLAAWHGGELTNRWLPPMWIERFGEDSILLRAFVGLAGGILMAFGARLAGGCTSGHGISGTLQLNVASWISLVCFFIGGVIVANLIYRL